MSDRPQEATGRLNLSVILPVATACALVVQVFVWPLVLSMGQLYVWFLAFRLGALAAAIGASWAGTLLASARSHSRLLSVFAISEATAAVFATAGYLVLHVQAIESSILLSILTFFLTMAAVVLVASRATLRFRVPGPLTGLEVGSTLGLVALAVMVYFGTLFLAPLPT